MKYTYLSLLALLAILSGCADKDKKGDGAAFGDSTDNIYDQSLPERSGNPDTADFETLKAETIFFAYDSFTIEAKERPKLDKLANYLSNNSNTKIVIAGHTDARGTPQYNLALSEKRATAVRQYLIGLGANGSNISTVGYGEDRPAVEGESDAANNANRRAAPGILR
ncbi:OmpA family protein [bacterium]|nr:OmpA family protein [bacterium]NBV97322.1 OmpA family protein [Verrucomicrobiota bacterium]